WAPAYQPPLNAPVGILARQSGAHPPILASQFAADDGKQVEKLTSENAHRRTEDAQFVSSISKRSVSLPEGRLLDRVAPPGLQVLAPQQHRPSRGSAPMQQSSLDPTA